MKLPPRKLVVAITGASGSIYAQRLFQALKAFPELEVGVVLSRNAKDVWAHELGGEPLIPYPVYALENFLAPFASGSARYTHMIIVPCSMGTLSRIATGFSDDLITRAADVILKERRRLVCVLRDTPLSLIHIENMRTLTLAGGIVLPAIPSFYSRPTTIEGVVDTVIHRAMDLLDLPLPESYRWGN